MRTIKDVPIHRINGINHTDCNDCVAAEEPLEIRVEGKSVAVVMRTPGADSELAAGFLVTEGLVRHADDIAEINIRPHCAAPPHSHRRHQQSARLDSNVVDVRLADPGKADLGKLTRHVFTSSSCGICSKASIEAVRQNFPPVLDFCEVDPQVLMELPAGLSSAQKTFQCTGGLHACGLFNLSGELLMLHEDVGRHNALDKIVGWALLEGRLPLHEHILLLSGRTSFEMMQKALAAGVPIVAGVSAPSSLAVEFAHESGQTLVGFLRERRMNIYAGAGRIRSFIRAETIGDPTHQRENAFAK